MTLEFELQKQRKAGNIIVYDVLRKGLKIGMLILEEPYHIKTAQKEQMKLYNRGE